ncbi:MAG TPA: EamA family transporter [Acidobacteriaceae bacterium]|jgi:drug/metabolite transporter (DMT)-like permease|nr:EamA family transporter [Acidobacteriaceae bacterium]
MPVRKLLAYAAIYILWGGTFLAIREVVRAAGVPPFFAAGCRFFLAGLILFVWARLTGAIQITPRQVRSAVLLGLVMFTGDYAALFWAETRVASGLAAVVFAMIPVWIFAGEVFVVRTRRATAVSASGLVLGFAGVVLLAVRSPGPAHSSVLAMLVMLAGTLCWSVGTLWSRHLPMPRPQQASAGLQMLTGGFFLLLLAASVGEFRRLPATAVLFSPRVVFSLAYLVVAGSMISYSAYVWLISHDSPTRVASYAYVNPVIAVLLGAAFAGERLNPYEIAGAALVLFGVFATLVGRGAAQTALSSREKSAVNERRLPTR